MDMHKNRRPFDRAESSFWRVPDRVTCEDCGDFLGAHDGEPPYKCRTAGCTCAAFVTPRGAPERLSDILPLRRGAIGGE